MSAFIWTKNWCEKNSTPHITYDEIGSTNVEAKRANLTQAEMTVFLARKQLVGKGRGKNSWLDTGEDCMLSSWALPLKSAPSLIFPPLAGLAVHKSLSKIFDKETFGLKPPNDLFSSKGKVAGILIEVASQGDKHRAVIGLGVNVLSAPEVEGAACLSDSSTLSEDLWSDFLTHLAGEFEKLTKNPSSLSPEAKQELIKAFNQTDDKYQDIDDQGNLTLKDGSQIKWENL